MKTSVGPNGHMPPLLLLLIILFPSLKPGCAADFDVSGEMKIKYMRGEEVWITETNQFQVVVRGCKSYFRLECSPASTVEYVKFYSQPDLCFQLSKSRKRAVHASEIDTHLAPSASNMSREPINDQNVEVYGRTLPFEPNSLLSSLWVAFGSACYFAQQRPGTMQGPYPQIMPPFFFEGPLQWAWMTNDAPAEWRLSELAPHLPASLLVCLDGKSLGYRVPYNVIMTNAIYEALSWTNVAGLSLPTSARIRFYRLDPNARNEPHYFGPNDVYWHVHKIETRGLTNFQFQPEITPKTRVSDYRYVAQTGNVAPITYMATEGRLLDRKTLLLRQQGNRLNNKNPLLNY